jgi:hypothetical protein
MNYKLFLENGEVKDFQSSVELTSEYLGDCEGEEVKKFLEENPDCDTAIAVLESEIEMKG